MNKGRKIEKKIENEKKKENEKIYSKGNKIVDKFVK